MISRRFKVAHTTTNEKIVRYFVTDANTKEELDTRPHAAVFPISIMFDDETQSERAGKFADYLNKIVDATNIAYEQTNLIDMLSKP